jgi:hypothetical protein
MTLKSAGNRMDTVVPRPGADPIDSEAAEP